MEDRLFVQFIALILATKIKLIINEANLYKKYDMQQIIEGIKYLREVKAVKGRRRVISSPTALQDKIMQLFKLSI